MAIVFKVFMPYQMKLFDFLLSELTCAKFGWLASA